MQPTPPLTGQDGPAAKLYVPRGVNLDLTWLPLAVGYRPLPGCHRQGNDPATSAPKRTSVRSSASLVTRPPVLVLICLCAGFAPSPLRCDRLLHGIAQDLPVTTGHPLQRRAMGGGALGKEKPWRPSWRGSGADIDGIEGVDDAGRCGIGDIHGSAGVNAVGGVVGVSNVGRRSHIHRGLEPRSILQNYASSSDG